MPRLNVKAHAVSTLGEHPDPCCTASPCRYVLSYIEHHVGLKRGEKIWQMGFGSGFKCNSAVWRARKRIRCVGELNTGRMCFLLPVLLALHALSLLLLSPASSVSCPCAPRAYHEAWADFDVQEMREHLDSLPNHKKGNPDGRKPVAEANGHAHH